MFCNDFFSFYVFIKDFTIKLGATIIKIVIKKENLNSKIKFA